jgi:hypothetical protein
MSVLRNNQQCFVATSHFTAPLKQRPPWFEEISKIVEALELEPDLDAQCLFVRETAREVGFKFLPQEILPGVVFCAAERMLLEVNDPQDL